MSTDDGDIEDDGFKSLRAVWLSMPDEEPPERGLAELMAAARVKAEEMGGAPAGQPAEPSLWQRFVDLMRRPQMLALATIMILIGGAVFISQRRDKLEASDPAGTEATTSSTATPTAGSATQPAADQMTAVQGEAARVEAVPAMPDPAAADPGKDDPKLATPAASESPRERADKPADTKQERKATPAPKKRPASKSKLEGDFDSPLMLDGKTTTGAKAGGGGGTGTGTRTAPPPADEQTPTVKQLHDQARAAAERGDCAAARSLAKKIAARDAAYYRANIAPDQSLASCLN